MVQRLTWETRAIAERALTSSNQVNLEVRLEPEMLA
jgi:hypothetical protein